MNDLIKQWRLSLSDLSSTQVEELETHLCEEMQTLQSHGLNEREAFTIAAMRCGRPSELATEFFTANPSMVWAHRLRWGIIGCLVALIGMPILNLGADVVGALALRLGLTGYWLIGIILSAFALLSVVVLTSAGFIATRGMRLPTIQSLRVRRYLGYVLITSSVLMGLGGMFMWEYPGIFPSMFYMPLWVGFIALWIVSLSLNGLWQLRLSRGGEANGAFQWIVYGFCYTSLMCLLWLATSSSHLFLYSLLGTEAYDQFMMDSSYSYIFRFILLPVVLLFVATWAGRRLVHATP